MFLFKIYIQEQNKNDFFGLSSYHYHCVGIRINVTEINVLNKSIYPKMHI